MLLYNATEERCNEVGYLYLSRNIEYMELEFATDMQDVSHVKILGAQKVTDMVGRYIDEHYRIPDRRSERKIKEDWDAF